MLAGFSHQDISPPVGMAMEGLSQSGGIEAIHDPLKVRALWVSHEDTDVLILGYDVLFFERQTVFRFKNKLRERFGLQPEQILINTSHTHAGPRLTTWHYNGIPDVAYMEHILDATLTSTARARDSMREVTIRAGMTETGLPVSRRQPDGRGGVVWAPWPDAEVCRALPVVAFTDDNDDIVSVLFSVSCHPSMIFLNSVSADYPGVAMRQLNKALKTEGALFLQGCGGDAKPAPIAEGTHRWRQGTWEDVETAGRMVADEVLNAVKSGLTLIEPTLGGEIKSLSCPLQSLPSFDFYQHYIDDPGPKGGRDQWAREKMEILMRGGSLPESLDVDVHFLWLGPELKIVALEAEAVGELGNVIDANGGPGITLPLAYSNGARAYLPTSHMVREGGYEVDSYWEYHLPAPLAEGIEDKLAELMNIMM